MECEKNLYVNNNARRIVDIAERVLPQNKWGVDLYSVQLFYANRHTVRCILIYFVCPLSIYQIVDKLLRQVSIDDVAEEN